MPSDTRALSFTVLAAIAGFCGALIGAGVWGGNLARTDVEHERRITSHDARLERLEAAIVDTRVDLTDIRGHLRAITTALGLRSMRDLQEEQRQDRQD